MNKRNGFTLIEVILVLAIAALIILMVLLTLPAVQRVQRDNDRRQWAAKVIAAYTTYISNNGRAPQHDSGGGTDVMCEGTRNVSTNVKCPLDSYLDLPGWLSYVVGRTILPTETNPLNVADQANVDRWVYRDAVKVYNGATCDNSTIIRGTASKRAIAAVIRLENNSIYCVNN